MPFHLFTQYTLQYQRRANVNWYSNGESQAGALVGAERRLWDLAQRLTATPLAALQALYVAQNGQQIPMWFYDTTIAGTVYDATGVLTAGRVAVTFHNDTYSHTLGLGRASSLFALIEVA